MSDRDVGAESALLVAPPLPLGLRCCGGRSTSMASAESALRRKDSGEVRPPDATVVVVVAGSPRGEVDDSGAASAAALGRWGAARGAGRCT